MSRLELYSLSRRCLLCHRPILVSQCKKCALFPLSLDRSTLILPQTATHTHTHTPKGTSTLHRVPRPGSVQICCVTLGQAQNVSGLFSSSLPYFPPPHYLGSPTPALGNCIQNIFLATIPQAPALVLGSPLCSWNPEKMVISSGDLQEVVQCLQHKASILTSLLVTLSVRLCSSQCQCPLLRTGW